MQFSVAIGITTTRVKRRQLRGDARQMSLSFAPRFPEKIGRPRLQKST
jgi:hypothetical protein